MVQVTEATEADVEEISRLVGEIEVGRGGTYAPGDVDRIRAALFGEVPGATVLLAREGDHVLGMACFSVLPAAAGGGTGAWLKELFLRKDSIRGRGTGLHLLDAVFVAVRELGCTYLERTSGSGDLPAPRFYERTDAVPRNRVALPTWAP
ncbi:GNAT family N-acetyltransferase [Streptomyces sp. MI02-7b]|uniref:GNAT family N-acetyltransferase n=1 Tax=Streptomyces sp. MI02-7b TaxID=462941 RepID=UPI0029A611B3|nr:GNAT family N-acetyltransferase [Streptomyces sp. MI02-7b]MDX3071128.1 GNAT family N-acetyltransferase [Streptomyces sp. MI02-7b]